MNNPNSSQPLHPSQPLQATQASTENFPKSTAQSPRSQSSPSLNPANPQPTQSKKTNKKLPIILVLILMMLVVGGVAAYYTGVISINFPNEEMQTANKESDPGKTKLADLTDTVQDYEEDEPLFSGKVERLNKNLDLFNKMRINKNEYEEYFSVYYSAGVFNSSPLQGYTRVIAVREPEGPGPSLVYTLATQDFITYVLDDPFGDTIKHEEDNWQNPFNYLDKTKISSIDRFVTNHPQVIELNETFSLYLNDYYVKYVDTGLTQMLGNHSVPITEPALITSLKDSQLLDSPHNHLRLFYEPYQIQKIDESVHDDSYILEQRLRNKYILSNSSIVVVDSTGLPAVYSLSTRQNIDQYNKQKPIYEQEYKDYQAQLDRLRNQEIKEYPSPPEYLHKPALGFSDNKVQTNQNINLFNSYQTAFPYACGFDLDTHIVKVDNQELEQIGTVFDQPLYRLIDPNHELNQLAYSNKMDYYLRSAEDGYDEFGQMHDGRSIPTYEEYLAKTPLLFFQDFWQRWVAVGEYDILLPGGCGKPVIYLYPTEPTEVTVEFLKPVQLSTHLPKYVNQWRVLAQPNGNLKNLQPELTNCAEIDDSKPGLEYGAQACKNNNYPYLYWSGNVFGSSYPQINQGWVVSQTDLNTFLNSKLNYMGLNAVEKSDFMEYWLPQMLRKKANYYRVSFLQTHQLNQLIPMRVEPTPDTTFRIFLDWQPLNDIPEQLPEPQKLFKLNRHGFTLVEWGGLKL